MGVDIHLILCKYDETDNLYHELALYTKGMENYHKVRIFEGRNSEMFGIMQNEEEDMAGHFPSTSIALPSLEESVKKEIKEQEYCYGFQEVTLADIQYYLKDHPTIVDYEADWGDDWKPGDPKPMKKNPIQYLFDNCLYYAEFVEGWSFGIDPYSRYKLLYWFDH